MYSNDLYYGFLSKNFSRFAELLTDNLWQDYGLNKFGREMEFVVVSMDECHGQGPP